MDRPLVTSYIYVAKMSERAILFFILAILIIMLIRHLENRRKTYAVIDLDVAGGGKLYGEKAEMMDYWRMSRDNPGDLRGVFQDAAEDYLTDYKDMEDEDEFGMNSDDNAIDL